MPALSVRDLLRPVLFCFCHRMFLFRFLELDAARQENKFIEYEHERSALMLFFLTAVHMCICVHFPKDMTLMLGIIFFIFWGKMRVVRGSGGSKIWTKLAFLLRGGTLSPSLPWNGLSPGAFSQWAVGFVLSAIPNVMPHVLLLRETFRENNDDNTLKSA